MLDLKSMFDITEDMEDLRQVTKIVDEINIMISLCSTQLSIVLLLEKHPEIQTGPYNQVILQSYDELLRLSRMARRISSLVSAFVHAC